MVRGWGTPGGARLRPGRGTRNGVAGIHGDVSLARVNQDAFCACNLLRLSDFIRSQAHFLLDIGAARPGLAWKGKTPDDQQNDAAVRYRRLHWDTLYWG